MVVTYAVDTHTIAASAGEHGSIAPPGEVEVGYGSSQTFNFDPDEGYHVADVLVDGGSVGAPASYEFTNVTAEHTIAVSFAINTYTVQALIPGGHGTAIPPTQDVSHGFPANISFSAAEGYHIADINDNGAHPPITDDKQMSYTITNVTEAHTVTATLSGNTVTVNASVSGGNGTVAPPTQQLPYGDQASITITPAAHYHIATITDNGTLMDGPYSSSYVIDSVGINHDVVVTFAIDTNAITASAGAGGTINPSGIVSVNYGSDRLFTITPSTGYHIADLCVDSVSVGAVTEYQFTNVTAAHTIQAGFAIDTFTVGASVTGGGGSVWPSNQTVDYNNSASITLLPSTGYHVNSVSDNGTPMAGPYGSYYQVLKVRVNHAVVVTYAINTYTIQASVNGAHGTVSPSDQTANWGSNATVTITPEAGYHVASITDNGVLKAGPYGNTYTLSAVAADHAIVVAFAPDAESQTWYLAEGATAGGMQTYVLVQNPGDGPLSVNIKFQTDAGEVQGPIDTVPAQSRRTYLANAYLSSLNVSTSVTATGGPVVERAMYGNGGAWTHDSVGTTSPANTWFLAEGAALGGMGTYILVQNPGASAVNVDVKFQTGEGEMQGPLDTLPAHSRHTYRVGNYVQTYDVSTRVTSTGGAVVVERSMHGANWAWGTCSIGTSVPDTTWYMAEGSTRGGMDTYVLIQNPGASAVSIDVKFQTENGQIQGPQVNVPARSCYTVHVNDWVDSFNVSTAVTGSGSIICERALFDTARTWASCTIGAHAPAAAWCLAEGSTQGMGTYILAQNPGAGAVNVDQKFQTGSGQVQGPVDTIPAYSRRTYYANSFVTSSNASTLVTASGGGVVVERSMYGANWAWATGSIGYAP